MSNLSRLNKMLQSLETSTQQGVIASNSKVRTFKGNFEGSYYSKAYCIDAGKIVFVGHANEVENVILDAIDKQRAGFDDI